MIFTRVKSIPSTRTWNARFVTTVIVQICLSYWVSLHLHKYVHTLYRIIHCKVGLARWLNTMAGQQSTEDAVPVTSQANETNIKTITLVENAFPSVWHILLAAVVIVLVLVLAMIVSFEIITWTVSLARATRLRNVSYILVSQVRWIYRKRKYNRLRHFLIPTYTFDPNEEETWDTGIDSHESAIFAASSPQVKNSHHVAYLDWVQYRSSSRIYPQFFSLTGLSVYGG